MVFSLGNLYLHFLNTLIYLQYILQTFSCALPSQSQFVLSYCISSLHLPLVQQKLLSRSVCLQHFIVETTHFSTSLIPVHHPSATNMQCCLPNYIQFQNTMSSKQGTVRSINQPFSINTTSSMQNRSTLSWRQMLLFFRGSQQKKFAVIDSQNHGIVQVGKGLYRL